MIKLNIEKMDSVLVSMLRQISGGNCSPENVKHVIFMLEFFEKRKDWLLANGSSLIPYICYVFLRLISEHNMIVHLKVLQDREVKLVHKLLSERFEDCRVIGRDLIRLLQDVANIPIFAEIWKSLLNEPNKLSKHFSGVEEILSKPTPRRFTRIRVTSHMEAPAHVANQVNDAIFALCKVEVLL